MSNREFKNPLREVVSYENLQDGSKIVFDGEAFRREDDVPNGPALENVRLDEYRKLSRSYQACAPGEFAWDDWETWAIEAGVPEDLAKLGRDMIREAYQHSWPDDRMAECGWNDNGVAMLELALMQPEVARKRWAFLLETDGDRGW